ncbi:MAG TPA: histidine phosphatase family protein [Anaerolineaceae bacterium]
MILNNLKSYYTQPERRLNLPSANGLLLLRHAERTPILTTEDILNADLTAAGKQQARALGQRLAQVCIIDQIVTSPVLRCIHTAQELALGYRPVIPPAYEVLPVLHLDSRYWGVPGLDNTNLVDVSMEELFNAERLAQAKPAADALVSRLPFPIKKGKRSLPHLTIAITHDTIVSLAAAHLLGAHSIGIDDYPGFLNGILLEKQDGRISVLLQEVDPFSLHPSPARAGAYARTSYR